MTKRKLNNLIKKVLNGQKMTVAKFTHKVLYGMPLCVEISGLRSSIIAEYTSQNSEDAANKTTSMTTWIATRVREDAWAVARAASQAARATACAAALDVASVNAEWDALDAKWLAIETTWLATRVSVRAARATALAAAKTVEAAAWVTAAWDTSDCAWDSAEAVAIYEYTCQINRVNE